MNFEIIMLNGYGFYVWPAFTLTFLSFFFLYYVTRKDLKRHERLLLLENKNLQNDKIVIIKRKKIIEEALSAN